MIGREATREKPSLVGNAAKMREALVMAQRVLHCAIVAEILKGDSAQEALNVVTAALSTPPRNCDRPECATTKAAQDVWRKEDGGKTAYYEWLLDEAKGGAN